MTDLPAPPPDLEFEARWTTILGTLSLDLTRGHMAVMGLVIPDEARFQEGLRVLILRGREEEDGTAATVERFLDAVFAWVRASYGPAFESYFRAWGDTAVPYGSRGIQVFYWRNLVLRGGLDGSGDEGIVPAFVTRLRHELAVRSPDDDVERVPKSAWDVDYFSRHGHGAYGPEGEMETNPMDLVENTIWHHWFTDAWEAAIARSASPEADIEELWQWGQREAPRYPMRPSLLERPGNWPPVPRSPAR